MRRSAICLLALLLQTSDASSEIFRWVDEAGKLHFAQSIQQVPPQYRKQALGQSATKSDGSFQTYTKSAESPWDRQHPENTGFRLSLRAA